MASSINSTSTGSGGLISTGDDSGILNIQTNETTAITVDAGQQIGVGTTSPSNFGNANNRGITINGQGTAGFIELQSSGTAYGNVYANSSNLGIRTPTALPILFETNGANERMRIDSSGRLLVGTTSEAPGYGNTNTGVQISGSGSMFSRAATDYTMTCNQNTVDGSTYYQLQFRVSNVSKGSITSTSSGTAYNTTSDYRLKENISPMTSALAKVAQLKPVTYKWKIDGSDGEGFIAHELAEVCPQAVSGAKDAVDENGDIKPQGIDVSFLVATLTAALQETKALIDTQAETINALTARIVALEGQ